MFEGAYLERKGGILVETNGIASRSRDGRQIRAVLSEIDETGI